MAELPETLSTAVTLRDLQEFSYQEIADQLHLPEGTVKSRMFNALAHLRTLLADPGSGKRR